METWGKLISFRRSKITVLTSAVDSSDQNLLYTLGMKIFLYFWILPLVRDWQIWLVVLLIHHTTAKCQVWSLSFGEKTHKQQHNCKRNNLPASTEKPHAKHSSIFLCWCRAHFLCLVQKEHAQTWLFIASPPTHSFETCSKRSAAFKEYNRFFNMKIFFPCFLISLKTIFWEH